MKKFDLCTGEESEDPDDSTGNDMWLDEQWLYYDSCNGTSGLFLPDPVIFDFIDFLKYVTESHHGIEMETPPLFTGKETNYHFWSDEHDEDFHVNIGMRGCLFISVFNMNLDVVASLIEYLETAANLMYRSAKLN